MKPRRFWIAAPFVVAGLACGASPVRSAEPHWPQAIALATASPGGTYHAYGAGLARMLTRVLGLPVATRATEGPNQNLALIEAGEAQLGFVTMGVALQGWNGTDAKDVYFTNRNTLIAGATAQYSISTTPTYVTGSCTTP